MAPATTHPPADASRGSGPLNQEAHSLRQRAEEIHAAAAGMEAMDGAQVQAALEHLRPIITHIAAHGDAEEHIVYPYMQGGCDSEVSVLREDHVHLKELARSIAEWKPGQDRAALHRLLDEFCDISTAHFVVEGEVCMPVVHSRTPAGSEQLLFEAVEIEVFEDAVKHASPQVNERP